VTASFAGSASVQGASAGLTQVITALGTVTSLTVSPNPQYATLPVTLTASVGGGSGGVLNGGTVSFYDGGTALATQPVSAGSAVFTTSSLGVGTHPITATYTPASGLYVGSGSGVVEEVILPSGFRITLSPSTITLGPGASGTDGILLTSVGVFAGPLALSYGALPQYATAKIAPATVTLTAGGTAGSALTLNTLFKSEGVAPRRPGGRVLPMVFAAGALLLLPLAVRRKLWARRMLVVMLGLGAMAVTGCTNQWYKAEAVAPGTYLVPVTATDASGDTQTAVLTVMVTP
jgi:hypothetical protein